MRKLIAKLKKANVLHTGAFMAMVELSGNEIEFQDNFVLIYGDIHNEVIKGNDE